MRSTRRILAPPALPQTHAGGRARLRMGKSWTEALHPRAKDGEFGLASDLVSFEHKGGQRHRMKVEHVGRDADAVDAAEEHLSAADADYDRLDVPVHHAGAVSADASHIVHSGGVDAVELHGVHDTADAAEGHATALSRNAWSDNVTRGDLPRDPTEDAAAATSYNAKVDTENAEAAKDRVERRAAIHADVEADHGPAPDSAAVRHAQVAAEIDEEHGPAQDDRGGLRAALTKDGEAKRDKAGRVAFERDGKAVTATASERASFEAHFEKEYPAADRAAYPGAAEASDHFDGKDPGAVVGTFKHGALSAGDGSGGQAHVIVAYDPGRKGVSIKHVGTDAAAADAAERALPAGTDYSRQAVPLDKTKDGPVASAHLSFSGDVGTGLTFHGVHDTMRGANAKARDVSRKAWAAKGPTRGQLPRDSDEEDDAAKSFNDTADEAKESNQARAQDLKSRTAASDAEAQESAADRADDLKERLAEDARDNDTPARSRVTIRDGKVARDAKGEIRADPGVGAAVWTADDEAEFDDHVEAMFPAGAAPAYPGLAAANTHFRDQDLPEHVYEVRSPAAAPKRAKANLFAADVGGAAPGARVKTDLFAKAAAWPPATWTLDDCLAWLGGGDALGKVFAAGSPRRPT